MRKHRNKTNFIGVIKKHAQSIIEHLASCRQMFQPVGFDIIVAGTGFVIGILSADINFTINFADVSYELWTQIFHHLGQATDSNT